MMYENVGGVPNVMTSTGGGYDNSGWNSPFWALIIFVVFGPKNLPKLGKMFGSTMKEVRKGMNEFTEEMNEAGGVEEVKIDPDRKVAKIIYEDEVDEA